MQTDRVEYFDDHDALLSGYIVHPVPTKNPLPAILVAPDWSGCNTFAIKKAEALAQLGYVGFAIDIYGAGKTGNTKEEKKALIQPFLEDRLLLRKRIIAAFKKIQTFPYVDSSKIAAIGFCFGGLCVLDLARSGANIKGVVSFHGLLNKPEKLSSQKINAKVLVLHGYADPMVPPAELETFANEMTTEEVDWQIHCYGNTLHAFSNPEANDPDFGTVYNKTADERSWESMKLFLAEIFS